MTTSRSYTHTTLKRLFALSCNACSFDRCEQKLADLDWDHVMAEISHIRGLNPGSARYDPSLSAPDANSFGNLIILCPNHHKQIDVLEPLRYSAEDLEAMKERHLQVLEAVDERRGPRHVRRAAAPQPRRTWDE